VQGEKEQVRTRPWAHALDGLSALDRSVLLATDRDGRDLATVARMVERSEDDVRAILHRARARVATALDLRD
tara:strand:+ start:4850 stop:5065 length:216 start_codon:yes stop_codon:yes gene_type:complete